MTTDIPEGFTEFRAAMGFVVLTGPLMVKYDDNGPRLGMRIEERHCNPGYIAHGGMLMTFADMQIGVGAQHSLGERSFLPTVHMSCDFAAPVPNGAWLEGETRVLRRTRSLIFASCTLTADGKTAFSASGIMKIMSDKGSFAHVTLPPLK